MDVAAAITDLYARYAHERGKPRYGDKTPANVLYVELLAAAFPQARFLHIVRDGRDVVPSLMEMHFGPDRFGAAALFWRDRVTRGRAGGRRVGADRYREIRYEDLVAEPEPVLRDICGFFELDVRADHARVPRAGRRAARRASVHAPRAGDSPPPVTRRTRLARQPPRPRGAAVRSPRR